MPRATELGLAVAEVGSTTITVDQVRNAYTNELQRLGRQFRTVISPEQARAIAAALGMATGAEAMIALFDVADLSADKARALVAETAHAICDRMLP